MPRAPSNLRVPLQNHALPAVPGQRADHRGVAADAGDGRVLGPARRGTGRHASRLRGEQGAREPHTLLPQWRQLLDVQHGLGVSIVPLSLVGEEVRAGTLAALPVKGLRDNWELGLVSLNTGQVSPMQQAFKQLCEKYFAEGI